MQIYTFMETKKKTKKKKQKIKKHPQFTSKKKNPQNQNVYLEKEILIITFPETKSTHKQKTSVHFQLKTRKQIHFTLPITRRE